MAEKKAEKNQKTTGMIVLFSSGDADEIVRTVRIAPERREKYESPGGELIFIDDIAEALSKINKSVKNPSKEFKFLCALNEGKLTKLVDRMSMGIIAERTLRAAGVTSHRVQLESRE